MPLLVLVLVLVPKVRTVAPTAKLAEAIPCSRMAPELATANARPSRAVRASSG